MYISDTMWMALGVLLLIIVVILLCIWLCGNNVNPHAPLIFIHIPKNAGTTLTKIGMDNKFNWTYSDGYRCNCSSWHTPPLMNIRNYKIPTFCVVRQPYSRILSEYTYKKSTDDLNKYIGEKLDHLMENPYIDDCHWLPQHYYTTFCDHILRFETLKQDFDNLMAHYRLNIKLDQHENKSVPLTKKLTIADISPENIRKINTYYKKDFELFGYTMLDG